MKVILKWALALLVLMLPLTVKAFVPPLPVVTTNALGQVVTNYTMPAFPARSPSHLMPLTLADHLIGFTDPLVWIWAAMLAVAGFVTIKVWAWPARTRIAWLRLRRHLHLGHHHHGHVRSLQA